MLSQGVSPLFFGSATDYTGRRPIYILCLTIYVGVTAGLYRLPRATESNKHAVYSGLIILRVVQAAGSASMVSIGAVRLSLHELSYTLCTDIVYAALRARWPI